MSLEINSEMIKNQNVILIICRILKNPNDMTCCFLLVQSVTTVRSKLVNHTLSVCYNYDVRCNVHGYMVHHKVVKRFNYNCIVCFHYRRLCLTKYLNSIIHFCVVSIWKHTAVRATLLFVLIHLCCSHNVLDRVNNG